MIMPFIRLVAIYAVVILAGVAFFNRDTIAAMTDGMSIEWWPWSTQAAADEPAEETGNADQAGTVDEAAPQSGGIDATAPETAASARPTANSPIQMPIADSDPIEAEAAPTGEAPIRMPVADAASDSDPEAPTQSAKSDPQPASAAQTAAPPPAPVQPAAPPANPDPAARLAEARRAYWAGDIAGALQLYAALVRDLPDNADARGEYGNILYAQRRYPEAADAYLATGKLLIGGGKIAQAQPIIAVLDAIAPQKAASLRAMATDPAARN